MFGLFNKVYDQLLIARHVPSVYRRRCPTAVPSVYWRLASVSSSISTITAFITLVVAAAMAGVVAQDRQ
jgi:hypothetical protein